MVKSQTKMFGWQSGLRDNRHGISPLVARVKGQNETGNTACSMLRRRSTLSLNISGHRAINLP
jgi:hypothetical protein